MCGFSFNHSFLLTFNMVEYVAKAAISPEPGFALLCRSFFRFQGLSYGATPICTACNVYFFGGGVGIVMLADSRRQVLPGRPVLSLFQLRHGV